MPDFSFIILTFNEELQLPAFFSSVNGLKANVFVLDSGSTDKTLDICREAGAEIAYHPFKNHPSQWDAALKKFAISTPWIIGLDADQQIDPVLFQKLERFKDADHTDINGIYFKRRYHFKGRWIRYGGYQNFYLLKMFRTGVGQSDLTENMDHRFIVPGKTLTWGEGYLLEENHKEDEIGFWIDKHNRYSSLIAREEVERMEHLRGQIVTPRFFGSPNQRKALIKEIWWKLPRYLRPFLYFFHRMIFRFGILDGRTGILFHFLHAFWFRLMVDVKIDEELAKKKNG